MELAEFKKMEITIVGLGLIGGSYAAALRKLQPKKIWAIDINQKVLEQAKKAGVIDGGFKAGKAALKRSELVIVCLYPSLTVSFIKENLKYFKQGAIITDTAGIKSKVVQEIKLILRDDLDYVGGHPLAGKESGGFENASADIFIGANYLLTPDRNNKQASLQLLEKIIKGIGCRPPIFLNYEEHDRIIALTSQLPHVIAAALVSSSQAETTANYIGGSFRDATRVAKMNADLWSELLLENKENILTQIDIFMDNITTIQRAIQREDNSTLKAILEKACKSRDVIEHKKGDFI